MKFTQNQSTLLGASERSGDGHGPLPSAFGHLPSAIGHRPSAICHLPSTVATLSNPKSEILLAQVTPGDPLSSPWPNMGRATRDLTLTLGALVVLVMALLIWAVYFRKRKREFSPWHIHHRSQHSVSNNGHSPERRRRRRRRREHRPRNPTLAETGGLPPARTERPPESFS
jgi:hypothetical protein